MKLIKEILKQNENNNLCLNCKCDLPESAFQFSNIVALKNGYCSFMCMITKIGKTMAYLKVEAEQEEAKRKL